MRTVRTVAELRAALAEPRRDGRTIGLVPTMGALHEGHLSLMRRARADCDEVVVSLFVNPTQFNDAGDLADYPSDARGDAARTAGAGVDYLFAPATATVYPPGYATSVSVAGVSEPLEGAYRGRSHFDGVTTVVTKLFNMVGPDVAYFGQKDAQQVVVIRRLVRDLDIAVRIEVCPTVREPDGLAMSSRNVHLSPSERTQATALSRALSEIEVAIAAGERDPEAALRAGRAELEAAGVAPDYLALASGETLEPATAIEGELLALVAARIGPTRLIDNRLIQLVPTANGRQGTANATAPVEGAPDRRQTLRGAAGTTNHGSH